MHLNGRTLTFIQRLTQTKTSQPHWHEKHFSVFALNQHFLWKQNTSKKFFFVKICFRNSVAWARKDSGRQSNNFSLVYGALMIVGREMKVITHTVSNCSFLFSRLSTLSALLLRVSRRRLISSFKMFSSTIRFYNKKQKYSIKVLSES